MQGWVGKVGNRVISGRVGCVDGGAAAWVTAGGGCCLVPGGEEGLQPRLAECTGLVIAPRSAVGSLHMVKASAVGTIPVPGEDKEPGTGTAPGWDSSMVSARSSLPPKGSSPPCFQPWTNVLSHARGAGSMSFCSYLMLS